MAQETFDYPAMLADAKAKRAALDAFIASLEAGLATGVLGQPGSVINATATITGAGATALAGSPSVELPVGALRGMSVANAIKLYLAACSKKQTTPEIADALREGGVESLSKNFTIIVNNTLRKFQKTGVVLKFKDGWALAEHYPESLRNRLAQQENGSKKKGTAKAKKRKPGRPPKTTSAGPSAKQEPQIQEMPKAS
jgi:hypothetical protein